MTEKTFGERINELASGGFITLVRISPAGSLEARKLATGITLYWRVTLDGKAERVIVGRYDSSAPPKSLRPTAKGYSIDAAIRAAEALALAHHANLDIGGHRGLVNAAAEAARAAAAAQAESIRKAEATKREAEQYTLNNLLGDYCDHLQSLGRKSHSDARSIFRIHIAHAWPKIAALPANQVTGEQVADMMRRVIQLGKGRTANKLRSYVRAAYQMAKASRSKASIPVEFKAFNVRSNPASDTEPDESANKADKNPLSAGELRTYWKAIKNIDGFPGALLRLHLLTGGQRLEQLVQLRTDDAQDDSILLYDGKGRPGKPARPHQVPLTDDATVALIECEPKGTFALSTDGGVTHVSAATLSEWAMQAGAEIEGFKTKRIRSGVETLLASARISGEHRGRLQSHGISGVQARHYDGHDYMDEKREALNALFNLLTTEPGNNVVPFKAA